MPITRLYVLREAQNAPATSAIQKKLNVPVRIISGLEDVFKEISSAPDPIKAGKETLILLPNKGAFIKKCPGTSDYICCGYTILHIGTFCTMDCSYCVLQGYFHPPVLQFFVNHDDMRTELEQAFHSGKIRRIGTGEFTDSLIWEKWINLSSLLVPAFSKQSVAVLELKTKTTAVEGLRDLVHNRKTIIAWSLNTSRVIQDEEHDTATLAERLSAASQCADWGYPLAFHFDPLVLYDGCEEEYRETIESIFSSIPAKHIVWISLGSFRFVPSFKPLFQKRHPGSKLVYGEFVTGLDNKRRYFKPLRIRLYRKIVRWIAEAAPDVLVYLCMEDEEVWKKTVGINPSEFGGLKRMLDESAARHCGLTGSKEWN